MTSSRSSARSLARTASPNSWIRSSLGVVIRDQRLWEGEAWATAMEGDLGCHRRPEHVPDFLEAPHFPAFRCELLKHALLSTGIQVRLSSLGRGQRCKGCTLRTSWLIEPRRPGLAVNGGSSEVSLPSPPIPPRPGMSLSAAAPATWGRGRVLNFRACKPRSWGPRGTPGSPGSGSSPARRGGGAVGQTMTAVGAPPMQDRSPSQCRRQGHHHAMEARG